MFEQAILFLSDATLPVIWILAFSVLVAYIENIFPPSPSDSIIVFTGVLVGIGKVGLIELLIATTIGSTLGFLTMFWLGWAFGNRVIESNRFKFINEEDMVKPKRWFAKYGYTVIIFNRFLSGTRAVISFFAGITKLKPTLTTILAAISSLIWNFLLIILGMKFGENWQIVVEYMDRYGTLVTVIVILIIAFFVIRWLWLRRREKNMSDGV
jgi:membrane protein DedA with SNARE-associated domain